MKRLYKIAIPGARAEADMLVARVTCGTGDYTLAGSGFSRTYATAYVQLYLESDEAALQAAEALVGPTGWAVESGYGIHRRIVGIGTDENWSSRRLVIKAEPGPVA